MSIKQLNYELDSICDYGRLELDHGLRIRIRTSLELHRWVANS